MAIRDLYSGPRQKRTRTIATTYDYGTAEKVRYEPKKFCWRRRVGDVWIYNLMGVSVGLYQLPELCGATTVYICEGEKAVDRLLAMGWPATCGPSGAGTWQEAWSQTLVDYGMREMVIFADHDPAGPAHAELVAQVTVALAVAEPVAITVVTFPDLPRYGDVVDFLDAHGEAALAARVAATPEWTPESQAQAQQARIDRKRSLTAARVRKLRANRRAERDGPASSTDDVTPRMSETMTMTDASAGAAAERRAGCG